MFYIVGFYFLRLKILDISKLVTIVNNGRIWHSSSCFIIVIIILRENPVSTVYCQKSFHVPGSWERTSCASLASRHINVFLHSRCKVTTALLSLIFSFYCSKTLKTIYLRQCMENFPLLYERVLFFFLNKEDIKVHEFSIT